MEAFLGFLVVGLIIGLLVALNRGSQLAARVSKAETELGYARQAFDALAARTWKLEQVVGELYRAGARAPVVGGAVPAAARLAEGAASDEAPGDEAPPGTEENKPSPEGAADTAAPEGPGDKPSPGGAGDTAAPELHPDRPAPGAVESPRPAGPAVPAVPAQQPVFPPEAASPPGAPLPPVPRPSVEWERWIGVRGAAALGAAVLVVAALYFFKYSIDQGLISPRLRVATGVVVGLGCLVASDRTRRSNHLVLANWLAGAGVAVLYTAFWALRSVYGLIGSLPAFGLMIAVTGVCVALAVRYQALAIAVLGLLGGFVTPFALSSGEDHPIGLFGYLLLLDVALLAVAHIRRWPSLAALSFLGTALYQVVWIAGRMDPGRVWLGIGIVLLFGVVFGAGLAVTATRRRAEDKQYSSDGFAQAAGALAPFAFGVHLGLREDLGPHFYPIGIMLCVLSAGAAFVAGARRASWIALAAAAASIAVIAVWLVRHDPFPVTGELTGLVLALAVVFHVAVEIGERREPPAEGTAFAALASLGGILVLLVAAGHDACVDPWPWLGAWAVLAALTLRHASFPGREALHVGVAVALGTGLLVLQTAHEGDAGFPGPILYLAVCASVPVVLLGLSFVRRAEAGQRWAAHAAALAALVLQIEVVATWRSAGPAPGLGALLLLGALALVASARLGSGAWALAATLFTAMIEATWVLLHDGRKAPHDVWPVALPLIGTTAALFVAWPLLVRRRFAASTWAWRAAALAGPVWLAALAVAWKAGVGAGSLGVVPAGLGVLALGAAALARRMEDVPESTRGTAVVSFAAAGATLLVIAVPVQLDNEWITLGWALEGLALVALFRRWDHAGLKYGGLSLLAIVTLRLVGNPEVIDYHPHAALPVFNWLLYTYAVPALCLLGAWRLLRDIEIERARPWERALYPRELPLGTMACALATIVVVFAWLNLTILDAFSTGEHIEVLFVREPARDLTISIAWAVYAIGLLALGMRRDTAALRWASLVLVLITVAKVFLYDLGNLKDLYRVASLVGLALSLILISLAYQRFVFGKAPPKSP